MPPRSQDLNDPAVWLVFAKSDLLLARKGRLPGIRLGSLCYLCQQSAEKALKAVLLRLQVEFSPTHNLRDLFDRLPSPVSPPPEVKDAARLSGYAAEGRYPQNFEDVHDKEYLAALKKAEAVLAWAEKILRSPEKPSGPFLHESPAVYKTGISRSPRVGKPNKKTKATFKATDSGRKLTRAKSAVKMFRKLGI